MSEYAAAINAQDPLGRVAERVLQSDAVGAAFPEGLRIDDTFLPDLCVHQSQSCLAVLYWQLSSNHIRLGPVVSPGKDGCRECFDIWIAHNRPDRQVWSKLPGQGPLTTSHLPWPPIAYHMLEEVMIDYLTGHNARSVIDFSILPLATETHRYMRSADCQSCTAVSLDGPHFGQIDFSSTKKVSPENFRGNPDVMDIARLRSYYVDYRTGLVRHMFRESSSVMLPMWVAETKVTHSDVSEAGYGRHASAQASESIAILEALERYCGQAPRDRRSAHTASYNALLSDGMPVTDPRDFILPADHQHSMTDYNLAPFDADCEYDWIWGHSFKRAGATLIPSQFPFYDQSRTPLGKRFVQESSNGCALGGSMAEAAFHGLLETIERDAYMTRWHLKGEPQRIDLQNGVSHRVKELHARASADGYELYAFDITLEIPVPTVLAMIVDPSADAKVKSYCASAAHPVADSAIYSALVEVVSSIAVYQNQFGEEREKARALYEDSNSATQMRDHVLLYSLPETISRLDFLDRSKSPTTAEALYADMEAKWRSDDLSEELNALADAIMDIADDVIVVDQTADLIRPMGLSCVKTLAPGTLPVTFGHQYRRISDVRLEKARKFLKIKGERYAEGQNPFPHNFP